MWDTLGLSVFELGNASMKLRVVVAITSTTAFLEVDKTPSLIRCIQGIQSFWPTVPISVAAAAANESTARELLTEYGIPYELLHCDPNGPQELATALMSVTGKYDAFLFHDASRPLTSPDQFARILKAFDNDVDAVRPSIAFTETLKTVGPDSVIKETLDRTQVRRISTPELIRTSAVDPNGKNSGWFVPLKEGAQIEYVEGNPESMRINSIAERGLLESFLHWKESLV